MSVAAIIRSRFRRGQIRVRRIAPALCLAAAVALSVFAQPSAHQPEVQQPAAERPARPAYFLAVEPIYSSDLHDPWNRLFCILFSRRFQVYRGSDFPDAAPFTDPIEGGEVRPSTRLFERTEIGDRAIDPLYYPPYNSSDGRRQLLVDPTYSEFMAAAQEALADATPRTALARAWMQSDLWSAYDILGEPLFPKGYPPELDARHAAALDALARLIRKIALTPEEIQTLPDNYSAAMNTLGLPDLFSGKGGWVEVQWFRERAHDGAAGYRRFSRIFVKPVHSPQSTQKILDALRNPEHDPAASLDGAAILIQLILIDSHGKLTPVHLTSEAELRLFEKTPAGSLKRTNIRVCEISRRLMLEDPQSGGLLSESEDAPAYFGSYEFASPTFPNGPSGEPAAPVVVKLRTRCIWCHGQDATGLMSFQMKLPPHLHGPTVKQLNPAEFEAADFAIAQKLKWFDSLRAYF